jgi:hypothetical protein
MLMKRQNCIAVLLVLLLSHAVLTMHVSTHASVDQAKCSFCGGHADPTHAVTNSPAEFATPVTASFVVSTAGWLLFTIHVPAFRQRGPPLLN